MARHTYTHADWSAGTVLGIASWSGDSFTFTNNGTYSLVSDDTQIFPMSAGITYYIVFSSNGSTGNIQIQDSVGDGHQTFGYNNTLTQLMITPSGATRYLQIGGGLTNWVSNSNAQVTFVGISDVSYADASGIAVVNSGFLAFM